MNSALRTSLLAAVVLASIDAEAKPLERCILSLEARPANVEATSEPMRVDRHGNKPRCPLAVVYPGRDASRLGARGPRFRSPAVSDDEAMLNDSVDTGRGSIASPQSALHV